MGDAATKPLPVRRVVVAMELDTALSLAELRNYGAWDQAIQGTFFGSADTTVMQVQANVIRPQKKAKKKLKRKPARRVLRARARFKKKKTRRVTKLGRRLRAGAQR